MSKIVQPLQSVNYHNSCAHGHERYGPFTQLVGSGGWICWVESCSFVRGMQ
jgi:hypothetical protein